MFLCKIYLKQKFFIRIRKEKVIFKFIKKAISMIIAIATVTTIAYSVQADSEPEISFCSYKDTVDYYHNTAYHPGKHKYEGNYNGIGGSIITNSRNIMWGVSSLSTDNIA